MSRLESKQGPVYTAAVVLNSLLDGRKAKYFASQKYGVDHITATHHSGNVLHASTKGNHDVRYHSAHDNKYLKYFKGHTET